ncbi:MAG: PHP domain-containing protein [Candidatus Sumerlaeia bacterium]|nr:PHP domain-containing protein [Candidatus Sumerlaeia bacterium]
MESVTADLHTHSTASDGVDPPHRVAERAAAARLEAFALTDHDTTEGLAEAAARAREVGVAFLPGIELTCYAAGREVHLLGYGVRADDTVLVAHCARIKAARLERARLIGERLAAAGAPLDMDAVVASADGGNVGRAHIAKALLDAGHVATWDEAFNRFLGEGKPANAPKPDVPPAEAMGLIHGAGGCVFVAHPALGRQWDLLPQFAALGLAGVEAFHPEHDATSQARAAVFALDRGLRISGGSDCHGALAGREPALGRWGLDESRWRPLREFLRSRCATCNDL